MKRINYVQIAETYFNKKLSKDEIVHHIDGNQNNNEPENLIIMKRSQHSRIHGSLFCALDEWSKRTSKICNTCFFIKIYEDLNIGKLELIDDDLSSWLMDLCIGNNSKPASIETIKFLYDLQLKWKNDNNHDCYKGKNLPIVKGIN